MELETKVLEAIKKVIYCDKHNHGDIIGFILIEGKDEDYNLIKDYFNLTPEYPFAYKTEDIEEEKSTEKQDFEGRFLNER